MYGICIESSHLKGMGHLFRMLNFINYIKSKNENYIVMVNDDDEAIETLKRNNLKFDVVNLEDTYSNWEFDYIKKYNLDVWINDRLDTNIEHARYVKETNIKLVTFDDKGYGAKLSDVNFGSLPTSFLEELEGKKVFKGIKYLILNKEIDKYQKIRNKNVDNIIVTLGGSDTYGVTIKVINMLKKLGKKATIIIGPSFKHNKELEKVLNKDFVVKETVPSLIKEFSYYDLAITGGGITPFEANASGLPCIIIANEIHEIQNGLFLNKLGSSKFIGHYKEICRGDFKFEIDDLEAMSINGISNIDTKALERIYNIIKDD